MKLRPYDLYPEAMSLARAVQHVASDHCFCVPTTTDDHLHARPIRRHRDVERVESEFLPFGGSAQ